MKEKANKYLISCNDVTRSNIIYESDNIYGIPALLKEDILVPKEYCLKPYRTKRVKENDICHFYLDDFRFEAVWNRLAPAMRSVSQYYATLTPDFSIYTNWTKAVNIYQVYRSRWIARHWQENNINIIPTVNWSNRDSFSYCFEGLQEDQTISISISDMRNKDNRDNFFLGLEEMQKKIKPKKIICYGDLDINKYIDCEIDYNTVDWIKMRDRITSPTLL